MTITGEEWRGMAGADGVYDPTAEADLVSAARGRIRDLRTRDVELRVVDRGGKPLAHTTCEIEQRRNAFPFGDQVWALDAMIRQGQGTTDRAIAWKQRFSQVFNAATSLCYWTERPENDASKTEDRQGEPRLENFAETVDWTLASGMQAKGHPLFWSIPKCTPEWAKRYDTETFMKFAEVRIRSLVARFKGRITIWDAVNEALWEAAPKNLRTRQWPHIEPVESIVEYVAEVLRWCREEDPDATFVINDYGLTGADKALRGSDGSDVTPATQRTRFVALARALQEAGQPPDALGMQCHTGLISHERQQAAYDEVSAAGLPIHITEFWAHARDVDAKEQCSPELQAELQAEYVANYLTCAFGHPAVESFFFWGFMEMAIQWRDRYSGHTLTPVFERVRRLLNEEWMTQETLTTDADGTVRFRGFLGDYRLRHQRGGHDLPFRLDRSTGPTTTLTLTPRN